MMKSFFKKLAFVMALAMVVSMAAPAGTAAYAAEFYIADEADKKAETYKLAIGEKEDFKFKGAPTDWKSYKWTWVSSNTKVLTVDAEKGIATGVADGTATITLTGTLNNAVKFTAVTIVTVGKGEVIADTEYEVKQLTASKMEIVFDGKHSNKIDDVVLFYVYENGDDTENINWPIKERKVNADGNFEITPYVSFENGGKYVVMVNSKDEGYAFTTEFGLPDRIDLNSFESNGNKQKAYTTPADSDDVVTKINVKLFSGEVDVTDIYLTEDALEYSFEYQSDESNSSIDPSTGEMTFSADRVSVVVKATYEYVDEDGEPQYVHGWSEVPIVSEPLPAYKVKAVTRWSLVRYNADGTVKDTSIDWSNPVHNLAAYDDDKYTYKIVALISDNYGFTYVTDSNYVDAKNKIYALDTYYDVEAKESLATPFANHGYEVKFESADVTKLLAGEEGDITTYTKCTVPVLIGLVDTENSEYGEISRYVGAVPVKVDAKREINKITTNATKNSITVATKDNGEDHSGMAYSKEVIEIYLTDQHGAAWTDAKTITVSADVEGASVYGEYNEDGTPVTSTKNKISYDPATKKAKMIVDGAALVETKAKSVNFTLKADDATANVKVSLKTPKSDDGVITLDKKRVLSAQNINMKVTEATKIPACGIITLTQTAGSLEVGIQKGVELYDADVAKEKGYNKDTVSKNDRFLVVYNPDNAIVDILTEDDFDENGVPTAKGIYMNEDETFTFVAAVINTDPKFVVEGTDEIDYMKTGTYSAKVMYVSGFDSDGIAKWGTSGNYAASTTFTVSNDSALVTYKGASKDTTSYTYDTDAMEAGNPGLTLDEKKDIVISNLKFQLGGEDWTPTADDIVSVSVRENAGTDFVIITQVVFSVDVRSNDEKADDGEEDDVYREDRLGYLQYINVNKAIQLGIEDEE